MKKLTLLFSTFFLFNACDDLDLLTDPDLSISESEAASGLKEALLAGTDTGTSFLGVTDGFLKSELYKILLPPEVRNVEAQIRGNIAANLIAGPYLDRLVTAMNRGAENAMEGAKPIFVNAITEMSITDAINIVTGGEGAATDYLIRITKDQLISSFNPVISKSLERVNIQEPWSAVSQGYNLVTGNKVNTDITDYVTDLAADALFKEIRVQENKIRSNPLERTTEILKKVFEYADSKK
jgi:hypothetical protein